VRKKEIDSRKDDSLKELFVKELTDLLDETFHRTQGIYLDRGKDLFATLEGVSAEQASRPVSAGGSTIAGHVEHMRYYLELLSSDIQGRQFGKVDWDVSWQVKAVTPEEWTKLREELRSLYDRYIESVKTVEVWQGEDDLGASLAILAHSAYHLGAIRQMLADVATEND